MRGKLTVAALRELSRVDGRHHDGGGLFLHVRSGRAAWFIRFQVGGQRVDRAIGGYPEIGLQDARERARQTRADAVAAVAAGQEISRQRRETRPRGPVTFRDAAERMLAQHVPTLRSRAQRVQWRTTIERAYPLIGDRPIAEITSMEVRDVLLPIWQEIPETARRTMRRMSAIFEMAIALGERERANPCSGLARALPRQTRPRQHHRSLPWQDVPRLWGRLCAERQSPALLALRFAIVTAARSGEVRQARWREVDWDAGVWRVPAEHMKSGRPHEVPLSGTAREILDACPGRHAKYSDGCLIFWSRGTNVPISDMALSMILRRLGEPCVPHGVRASFRSWGLDTGIDEHLLELALAHVPPSRVVQAYRRTTALDLRRPIMARWAAFVTATASVASRLTPMAND